MSCEDCEVWMLKTSFNPTDYVEIYDLLFTDPGLEGWMLEFTGLQLENGDKTIISRQTI